MNNLPEKLQKKIEKRELANALRSLSNNENLIDFSSNDYLGFGASEWIYKRATEVLKFYDLEQNGATGSRLLSGNHLLFQKAETLIASFHKSQAALIFNSGYDANLGFLSSVPQHGDLIFYDTYCHASIRDGMQLSKAKAYKFPHNNLEALQQLVDRNVGSNIQTSGVKASPFEGEVYIVTESVFSMDGDSPNLKELANWCSELGYRLVIDEAHAVGVFGNSGNGLVPQLGLEEQVFARIVTFGKALGCHGAAILGSDALRLYLINFARSFVYTTGLTPHSVATILAAYEYVSIDNDRIQKLHCNIETLRLYIEENELETYFISSRSAVHSCVLAGNDRVKDISAKLKTKGFDVKAILSPTVPEGGERLRICLHSFNNEANLLSLLGELKELIINSPFEQQ